MYPILEKRLLAEGIWLMKVLAPRVARSAQPGQFVIVRADEHGERIPLTISDFDAAEGSVTIVTQAIGPMIMMKFVALTTKKYALKTTVSLNALMVDGTGMCGACRVTVGGRTRFTCVDGPEFNAHEVDFDEAMRRQGMYRTQEQRAAAIEAEREAGHVCKIGLDK